MPQSLLPNRTVSIPLVIHRWFADGAMMKVAEELKPLKDQWSPVVTASLKAEGADQSAPVQVENLECGLLMLIKTPDPECPDPLARDRRPTILRCCLLSDKQLRSISVDRTAAIHIAALMLQNVCVPDEQQTPFPLHLPIPVCEPDFQHPVAQDSAQMEFRSQVLANLETLQQKLELLLQAREQSEEDQIPQSGKPSWWSRLFGRKTKPPIEGRGTIAGADGEELRTTQSARL
jgi:hypothetical protein